MSAPVNNCRPSGNSASEDALIMATIDGDLDKIKGEDALIMATIEGDLDKLKEIMSSLGDGNSGPAVLPSLKKNGMGLLHYGACAGKLEVCKYLVGELQEDVNMIGAGGLTPLMLACHSGDTRTVKYLLDNGGDAKKADEKGRTALHHAAGIGSSPVTWLLVRSKKMSVDIDCGRGTALCEAAINGHRNTVEILLKNGAKANTIFGGTVTPLIGALLKHSLDCMQLLIRGGADVNGKDCFASPLSIATSKGGYTEEVRLLLKFGANTNIPDDAGMLPVELSALNGCLEEVKMLFAKTKPIEGVNDWTVDGLMARAKLEGAKPLGEQQISRRKDIFEAQADEALNLKDYDLASKMYCLAIENAPNATLYSKRCFCRLQIGDGQGALHDANKCIAEQPKWTKGYSLQALAHMLLRDCKQACASLQKLDTVPNCEKKLRRRWSM